jgi:hypothetical protein
MLASLPWLTMLWRDEITMSDEDYAAWAFPTRAEMCAVYQAVPSPGTAGAASVISN